MDILRILPFEGLNTIKLGMTPDEIAAILGPPVHSRGEDCLDYDDINYTIDFRNGHAWEICVNNYTLSDRYRVMLHDVDLFGEKAEDVIRKLEALTPCTYEGDADKDLATNTLSPLGRFTFGAREHIIPNLCRTLSLSNSFRCMKKIWRTNFNFGTLNRSWSTTIQSACKRKKEAQKRLFLFILLRRLRRSHRCTWCGSSYQRSICPECSHR